ncbi:DNA replication and repair protein RecF [Candidatus Woesebacteria bacterium]|nr:DNA replication and repair protein RecF [Candidatus Woesebacteria bacterium]
MKLSKLKLTDFRNFKNKLINFGDKITIVIGDNAKGKTNILEAINLLATGKSFHARVEEEMIRYSKEIARVKGRVFEGEERTDLEVTLTRGEITVGENPKKTEKVAKKKLKVNGAGKRLVDFSGILKTVLFGPWHLDLVTESPSLRRDFLDDVLSQVDREYKRASLSYSKGLRRRNKILYFIREEEASRSQLAFWDKLLIKNGDYISSKRAEFIDYVNATPDFNGQDFSLEYDKSAISEARLEQYKEEEVAAATTLVGPHRDDLIFMLKKGKSKARLPAGRDLSRYGSRGEQRMGVLWLKLAELEFIKQRTEQNPVLLLDDIFSELDHEHRDIVMDVVKNQQTIITTADPHFVKNLKSIEIVKL